MKNSPNADLKIKPSSRCHTEIWVGQSWKRIKSPISRFLLFSAISCKIIIYFALFFSLNVSYAQTETTNIEPENEIKNLVKIAKQDCKRMENGTLNVSDDLITRIDLNADDALDYIVDDYGLNCSSAASLFSGSAGRSVKIYASAGSKWKKVFDATIQGYKIRKDSNPPKIWISNVGTPVGAISCELEYYYNKIHKRFMTKILTKENCSG